MTDIPPVMYCANHPQTETLLRCNRCEKPICIKCAVYTPTGYKCKECVRGQQKIFDTAQWYDFPIGICLAIGLSFLGSYTPTYVRAFSILIAPVVGFLIAESVRFINKRRRSKLLFRLTAAGAALGSLPLLLWNLFVILAYLANRNYSGLDIIIWHVIYTFLVTSTTYSFLEGFKIGRR